VKLIIKIVDATGQVLSAIEGEDEITLVHRQAYETGDRIVVEAETPCHLSLWLDAGLPPSPVFLAGRVFAFDIPSGERRKAYAPQAFTGDRHRLTIRRLHPYEIAARRNLAFNPYDDHGNETLFPHAFANVETRGEAVFAARNAIDGEKVADGHGRWPYTSWGINRDPEAVLTIAFGRRVLIDEAVLYLRADFPHDAWWEHANLTFSNGETELLDLRKTGTAQVFPLRPRLVEWVRLHSLVKADDPSPFPALTQIEFWGHEDGHGQSGAREDRQIDEGETAHAEGRRDE
jgi:hypothetical protein